MSQFNEYLLLQRATPNAWSALNAHKKNPPLPCDSTKVHYRTKEQERERAESKGMYFSCWLSNEL